VQAIEIQCRNKSHATVRLLTLPPQLFRGTRTVRSLVDDVMLPALHELKWAGFGLWAQHEPVKDYTNLDDLRYQRLPGGRLVLQCEDHDCQYRSITTPVVTSAECVVCLAAPAKTTVTSCMHICCCAPCARKLTACPICRKRSGASAAAAFF
jgi:hypothetical protein